MLPWSKLNFSSILGTKHLQNLEPFLLDKCSDKILNSVVSFIPVVNVVWQI